MVFLIIIKVVQPAGLEICFVRAQLFLELLSCTSPGIHGDEELMGLCLRHLSQRVHSCEF